MSATEAARAMENGVRTSLPDAEVVSLPVGDGGEGTAETVSAAMAGNEEVRLIEAPTQDALGRQIMAAYRIIGNRIAVIESAAASGLTLIPAGERDIMRAGTKGTGMLIADAYRRGVRDFMICMGGTASCDGGAGADEVLRELDLADSRFTLLCDVENPLCGPSGAAAVFGPQKGATPEMIPVLERRLAQTAADYERRSGIDVRDMKYAGAAGGLAAMLMALYGAKPVSGIEKVLELLDFNSRLEGADLVITGEGCADATTLNGKAAKGILDAARARGVPVAIIGGRVPDRQMLLDAGFRFVAEATPRNPDPSVMPRQYLTMAVSDILNNLLYYEA